MSTLKNFFLAYGQLQDGVRRGHADAPRQPSIEDRVAAAWRRRTGAPPRKGGYPRDIYPK